MERTIKSLKVNMFFNLLKTVFTTFFPLVSFKYVSYVLGKEKIGLINFSNSIVQYFSIIAALGVSTYAIRECSMIRDEKQRVEELGSELFSINILSTIVAYLLLFFCTILSPKLYSYRFIIFVVSLSIVCTTMGVEWINIVYEDFIYITIRTIVFQLASLCLTFGLVKDENDYIRYVVITVISSLGICISNWIYVKKYITLKFVWSKNLIKHFKAIMIIFFMNIAITIYVTSDITILGFLKSDAEVGLYTVSTKIYSCLKTILASVVSVTIPRLSYVIEKNQKEYIQRLTDIISILVLLCVPIVIGVYLVPDFLIRLISSPEYSESKEALQILGIAIFPTMFSTIINNNILLTQRKEVAILLSTCIGGVVNCLLNFWLIPSIGFNAAAITTLIAEILVCNISIFQARNTLKILPIKVIVLDGIKVSIGAGWIIALYKIFFALIAKRTVTYLMFIAISIVTYFLIEATLKHNSMLFFIKKYKK